MPHDWTPAAWALVALGGLAAALAATYRLLWYVAAVLVARSMRRYRRYDGSWRWRVVRGYVLRRDGRRCRVCGRRSAVLHVHHRRAVRAGGSHHPRNLEVLCPRCHGEVHGRPFWGA